LNIGSPTFNKILLTMICVSSTILGLWAIDISVAAMTVAQTTGLKVTVTSGWWTRDPLLHYHIGIYLVQISSTILAIIAIHESLRSLNSKTLKNLLKQIEYEEKMSNQFDMEEIKNEIKNELKRRKKKWDS